MKIYTITQLVKEYGNVLGQRRIIESFIHSGQLKATNINKKGKYKKWIITQESLDSLLSQ